MRGDYFRTYALVSLIVSVFLLGWLSSAVYDSVSNFDIQKPFSSLFSAREVSSPGNHIKKDQIHVYDDKIIIDLKGAQWAEFADTNSMDPVIDIGANSFEIIPSKPEDISVGDIISYQPSNYSGLIVHRVIVIGEDDDGWYAIVKGDNLSKADSEKVRFNQVNGVLVGIIY